MRASSQGMRVIAAKQKHFPLQRVVLLLFTRQDSGDWATVEEQKQLPFY